MPPCSVSCPVRVHVRIYLALLDRVLVFLGGARPTVVVVGRDVVHVRAVGLRVLGDRDRERPCPHRHLVSVPAQRASD